MLEFPKFSVNNYYKCKHKNIMYTIDKSGETIVRGNVCPGLQLYDGTIVRLQQNWGGCPEKKHGLKRKYNWLYYVIFNIMYKYKYKKIYKKTHFNVCLVRVLFRVFYVVTAVLIMMIIL